MSIHSCLEVSWTSVTCLLILENILNIAEEHFSILLKNALDNMVSKKPVLVMVLQA